MLQRITGGIIIRNKKYGRRIYEQLKKNYKRTGCYRTEAEGEHNCSYDDTLIFAKTGKKTGKLAE